MAKYFLSMWLMAPVMIVACDATDTLPAPEISSVNPDAEYSDAPQVLTLKGERFYVQSVRQLSRNSNFKTNDRFEAILKGTTLQGQRKTITLQNVSHVDSKTLKATLPKNSPEGTYAVLITAPDGQQCRKPNAFTVLSDTARDSDSTARDSDSAQSPDTDLPKTYNNNKTCGTNEVCETECSGSSCAFSCASNSECSYICRAQFCSLECHDKSTCELSNCQATKCSLISTSSGDSSISCDSSECNAEHNGEGTMHVECSSGCEVQCTETSPCIVHCIDESNCDVDCDGTLTKCPGKVYTCNTPCPS